MMNDWILSSSEEDGVPVGYSDWTKWDPGLVIQSLPRFLGWTG